MHPFLVIADRAARLAGKRIIQSFDNPGRLQIYQKKSGEVVTDLDYSVERLLIEHIHASYPTHSILTEESGSIKQGEEYLWIIDPLDGTNNFIHGLPGFAISLAIQKQEVLYQGLVYDPLAQETFYASRGQVAQFQQKRLRVSQHAKLKRALIYVNRPPHETDQLQTWLKTIEALIKQGASIRILGSAALGLAYVAAGRIDAFISLAELKQWDIAAGVLLVQQAGGDICDIQGGNEYLTNGKLIAGNASLCKNLAQLVISLA